MGWSIEFVNDEAKVEVDRLAIELRAKFERIVMLIQAKGLEQVREPYIKHLEGKLWEMRMSGKNQIARAIYLTAVGRRIVILHTFIKKTDNTPRRALKTARRRAEEVE